MEDIGPNYLLIGAAIGLLVLVGLGFLMWTLAAISAICDDLEGVRDE
jgi:hypothetical protein